MIEKSNWKDKYNLQKLDISPYKLRLHQEKPVQAPRAGVVVNSESHNKKIILLISHLYVRHSDALCCVNMTQREKNILMLKTQKAFMQTLQITMSNYRTQWGIKVFWVDILCYCYSVVRSVKISQQLICKWRIAKWLVEASF